MKKGLLLLSLLVLFSGCTGGGQEDETDTTPTGVLKVSASVDESVIEQGDYTNIEIVVENYFSKDVDNVLITLEPITTGITYDVTGPTSIKAGDSEDWTISIETSPGLNPRTYSLYPVICFDYTQKEIGYFRVADGEPSLPVDMSLSDDGPLNIIFNGLQSFDGSDDDKIDVEVTFSLPGSILGGTDMYDTESDLLLTEGEFLLDTVSETLSLATVERNVNALEGYCPVQSGGDNMGKALCYFDLTGDKTASDDFDFDIRVEYPISGEIESSFSAEVTYTYCFRSTATTSITVEES